jgi:hypothetical protein
VEDTTGVELLIDGVQQPTLSVTANEAEFKVAGVKDVTVDKVKIHFPDGYPTGHDSITE